MKKSLVLVLAAGLWLAACAKHDADATANADLTVGNGDFASDGVLTNADNLDGNLAVPADEANAATDGNAAVPPTSDNTQ